MMYSSPKSVVDQLGRSWETKNGAVHVFHKISPLPGEAIIDSDQTWHVYCTPVLDLSDDTSRAVFTM